MEQDRFSELLTKIPIIAKAVNAFKSETVQTAAFQALLDAFNSHSLTRQTLKTKKEKFNIKQIKSEHESRERREQAKTNRPAIVPELDLRPEGKQSFKEFFDEKKPKVGTQTYTLCVYYLERILNLKGITPNHVYTCMKDVGRKVPNNITNALSITASRAKTINTSNLLNITITVRGENMVEHDMGKGKSSK